MERYLFSQRNTVVFAAFAMIWLLLCLAIVAKAQTTTPSSSTYLVKPGDNPYRIAVEHGLTLEELYSLNPSIRKEELSIGQMLQVDASSLPKVAQPESKEEGYFIKTGDTWYSLSRKHQVSIEQLRKLNGGEPVVGRKLLLPTDAPSSENMTETTLANRSAPATKPNEPTNTKDNTENTEEMPSQDKLQITRKKIVIKEEGRFSEIDEKHLALAPAPEPVQKPNYGQTKSKKGGFDATLNEEEQHNLDQTIATRDKDLDMDSEKTYAKSEFSLTENRIITRSEDHPDDGTRRIMLIPFDPLLYLSDADEEIGNACGMQRKEVREWFRRRLNVLIEPKGYEVVRFMGGKYKDSLRDLDRIYASLEYNYQEILEDPDDYEAQQNNALGHQLVSGKKLNEFMAKTKVKFTQNHSHAQGVKKEDYSDKYFAVQLKNKEFVEMYNQKYGIEYYVFITQFEVKTHYRNTQERAANIFSREFIAHYTIMNNKGNFVKGNRISVKYDNTTKNVKKMVDDNMDAIAKRIIRAIPSAHYAQNEL